MSKKDKEIEECFLLYDYPRRGKISNSRLLELMNALGQNATEKELEGLIKRADPSGEGSFTLDGFKKVMAEFNMASYSRAELRSAYDLLDRDQDGLVSKADLKNASRLLLGTPLDEDKIDFMFKNLKVENNKINFDQFVKLLE